MGCALGRARFEFSVDVPVAHQVIEQLIFKDVIAAIGRLLRPRRAEPGAGQEEEY
jgi:hypothetical protein